MKTPSSIIILTAMAAAPITAAALTPEAADSALYHEPYRPQYHYTPAHRWIGDPCGLLRHGGRYLGYCWGAAGTPDLVHWTEINREAILVLSAL